MPIADSLDPTTKHYETSKFLLRLVGHAALLEEVAGLQTHMKRNRFFNKQVSRKGEKKSSR